MTASPQQIKLANQHPLNRAARTFLPKDWQANEMTELHVLSLMRWGLENGLEINARGRPTQEEVESRIELLAKEKPQAAIRFLVDPEKTGTWCWTRRI